METSLNQSNMLSTEIKVYRAFAGKPQIKKIMFSNLITSFLSSYQKARKKI
ncbi:hypothetical protein [Pedobacter mendelii]|uniref:hypothetical protein n=1 Tax=Pedobacter mendelii TaxID=1908240 RepID=UPI001663490B|nr:hypothetical protein [Pedobacter mendelii]